MGKSLFESMIITTIISLTFPAPFFGLKRHGLHETLFFSNSCNVSTFVRIIDLDVIVAVQDQPPSKQDINKSSFNVVTVTRTYELMAHDEDEKLKYCHLK